MRVRPRVLYFAVFAFNSITIGRFFAPFIEHEAGFGDALIGIVVAMQLGLTSMFGAMAGSFADFAEKRYPNYGRTLLIMTGVILGSLFFCMHATSRLFPSVAFFQSDIFHILLRALYSCSISMVQPVLDGLTLAHLHQEPGMDPKDYGKERLFGAIAWGVTNLVMGPFMDYYGYPTMYAFTLLSALVTIVAGIVYIRGSIAAAKDREQQTTTIAEERRSVNENKAHLPLWKLLQVMVGTISAAGFILSYFALNFGFSVVENLIFLFFDVLGASNTFNGFTTALTVLFEIPIFHIAPSLLRRYGPVTLLQIANIAFVIRVFFMTLIPEGKAFYVLLLEPLHGVIYGCSQTGGVEFVSGLMPIGYEASGQGLLFFFRGLGGITGLPVGGYLEERVSARFMYRFFAAIVTGGGVIFAISEYFFGTSTRETHATETERRPLIGFGIKRLSRIDEESGSMSDSMASMRQNL